MATTSVFHPEIFRYRITDTYIFQSVAHEVVFNIEMTDCITMGYRIPNPIALTLKIVLYKCCLHV